MPSFLPTVAVTFEARAKLAPILEPRLTPLDEPKV